MTNNDIKLTCTSPDTYRKLIMHFKEKGIYYHTYQLKEERAYRVVLKYLHHTTEVEDIQKELFVLGHVARNIVSVHHRLTTEPLNLFFIDLEPANNNKDIYNITAIQNKIIHIEPPRMHYKHIPQCVRCNSTDTHERTATNPTSVSNAVAHMTAKIAISEGIRQRNVPCVVGITRQTTKAASIITILSKETIHTELPQKP